MKIQIAKTAGFCMGVRRAVEMALDAPKEDAGPIYTYGPLIHNPQVLDLMREKGITILEKIPERGTGTVLIRAHGVPPDAREILEKAGYRVIDATCPRVIKVQTIIARHARKGFSAIIIGDRDHPEVTGLLGYAHGRGVVVDSMEELAALPRFRQAIIVAQTTQNTELYGEITAWAAAHCPHYRMFDTICDSTERRQAEVKRLAESVDALVVVGGRDSGNTRRLAEIGNRSGKPTFHIETESELDLEALASAGSIGITAGASTPNWIINRVCRTLETLPFRRARGWLGALFKIQRSLLMTNIYVSIGAGCLCYAFTRLQEIPGHGPYVLITILYVQSMHLFNNLTGIKADHYNDPERAALYNRHKVLLSLLAVLAGGAGLVIALAMGVFPFLILLVMSAMGLSYNLRLIPPGLTRGRYRRLMDVPGSKTVLIAVAWGVVTAVFPTLSAYGALYPVTVLVFIAASLLVFVRTAFFDVLDMQGDRIVGRGTIPILLGEKRTLQMLKLMLVVIAGLLATLSATGMTTGLGFALAACPAFLFALLSSHERGHMLPGIRLEFLVETDFILAGMITFFATLL